MRQPQKQQANEKLRRARLHAHMSQAQLAEHISVSCSATTVSRWECGRARPTPYYCGQLCTILKKSPQELGLSLEEGEPIKIQGFIHSSAPLPRHFCRTWINFLSGKEEEFSK